LNNGVSFEGEWKDNLKHGRCTNEIMPDKSHFEGHYDRGKKQGKGKMINIDGSRYSG
jgi:hypothetical protein